MAVNQVNFSQFPDVSIDDLNESNNEIYIIGYGGRLGTQNNSSQSLKERRCKISNICFAPKGLYMKNVSTGKWHALTVVNDESGDYNLQLGAGVTNPFSE